MKKALLKLGLCMDKGVPGIPELVRDRLRPG
jgi:hypothetical protein